MPPSVLLVDDNQGDLDLLLEAMREMAWEVEVATARHGGEALMYLARAFDRHDLPELVLLDLNMPQVNGWDLLAAMRRKEYAHTHRIAMTSSAAPADCERAKSLGAEECYVKPNDFDDLIALMTTIRGKLSDSAST